MTSLYVICWRVTKMELKSRRNYTHPSIEKVMPRSQFLIRFIMDSLNNVSQISFYRICNQNMPNFFGFYSQIPNSELLFSQSFWAIVCLESSFNSAKDAKTSLSSLG